MMRAAAAVLVVAIAGTGPISAQESPGEIAKAREMFIACAEGARPQRKCVEDFKGWVANGSKSQESREFSLEALAWLDVRWNWLDLRPYFRTVYDDESNPSYLSVHAGVCRWLVEVFGMGLGEDEQELLLSSLVYGTDKKEVTGVFVRRSAATELCARGRFEEEIRQALQSGFGTGARGVISWCETAARFATGGRASIDAETALQWADWSRSQAFRKLAISRTLEKTGRVAEERVAAAAVRNLDHPGGVLVARETLLGLRRRGWTDADFGARGIPKALAARQTAAAADGDRERR